MALKLMLSKRDRLVMTVPANVDQNLDIQVEVLFTGKDRVQLAVTAPQTVRLTRQEHPDNANRGHR